jgi:S-formylglutathione hydrolase FrmB
MMPFSQTDTLIIFSEAMQKEIPALVIKPRSYVAEVSKYYPSLYLLHGYSGDFLGYQTYMPDLEALADLHQIIFVCPDGGYNSWYLDSPYGNECRYETHISKEVVAAVDKNYRTINHQSQRAITGLSMGGHGALYNAIRHPEVFGAVGSMSGGVHLTPFPLEWEIRDRLGDCLLHKNRWEENSVMNMTHLIPENLPMIIDCGIDDFFMPVNRALHEKLLKHKIPHDYIERPGDHNWEYWANATRFQLLFFKNFFEQKIL